MIRRLEQVAALVVAAGLALVSYWLFFSWAQGGGVDRRQRPPQSQRSSVPSDRLTNGPTPDGGPDAVLPHRPRPARLSG